jgi:hypothetical protein
MICPTRKILYAFMLVALLLGPVVAAAETVTLPVYLNYRQLELLMLREMFTGPSKTVQYPLDESGCSTVTLSDPKLSAENKLLRVDAKVLAAVGLAAGEDCTEVTQWRGRATVTGDFSLPKKEPLSVRFRPKAVKLYADEGDVLTDNLVLPLVEQQLQSYLGRQHLDLRPATNHLKTLLPHFLPNCPPRRLTAMIDSLRIVSLQVRPNDLLVRLAIDAPAVSRPKPEPPLSESEMRRAEEKYRQWNAFLTFVVNSAGKATGSRELKSALQKILKDFRSQFKTLFADAQPGRPDPVKQLFMRSWERLLPVMRKISVDSPEKNLLPFLSFITAAEAIETLERLGPALGLDISANGLRRLARLLNDDPSVDPLKVLE